jgi:hypothetical protein
VTIDPSNLDLDLFPPGPARELVIAVLNQQEELLLRLTAALAKVEQLTAEVARLKGEHPPRSRGGGGAGATKPDEKPSNHSSEKERRQREDWKKSSKQDAVEVDRTEDVQVDRTGLPEDLQSKGVVRVVLQNLIVKRDNVEFLREKLYSPSLKRSFLAPLPPGYQGAFGPDIPVLVLELGYGANVTFPKIHAFLKQHRIQISRGKVSSLLTQGLEDLHAEAAAVVDAGLASSPWQQMDVTSTPVGGEWWACHILTNPLYSAFRTTPRQDRQSILATLWGSRAPRYRLDEVTLQRLEAEEVGVRVRNRLASLCREEDWKAREFEAALRQAVPRIGAQSLETIREVAGIRAYQAATDGPAVQCLHVDDAATFRELAAISLCWIHDGRHYHKLMPQFDTFRTAVETFLAQYWDLYRELRAYREAPGADWATALEAKFDQLFATEVTYAPLARCVARTRANKEKLLLVLKHPELPLHNNEAELKARLRVMKRRVSHGPKTERGAQAWDTFHTLAATTAKLGIRFIDYLHDRMRGIGEIPWLPDLIGARASELQLGASWAAT